MDGENDAERGRSDTAPTGEGGSTKRRTFLKGSMATVGASVASVSAGEPSDDGTRVKQGAGNVATATGDEMVATVHPQATRVGADVLASGGNAVDAAVATQFALNVVQPHSSGIGGGGFMLVYSADEDVVYAVDNRERAPLGATPEMFLDDDGEPIPFEKRHTSGQAVGVPGTLRACDVALKRFGSKSLAELIDPAISLASDACPRVTVDAPLAESIANNADLFNDAARSVFAPNGEPLQEGDPLVQPDLAKTFRLIRDDGIGAFYKGEIAEATAETVQESGGSMTVDDLAGYNVTMDHPEHVEFGDVTVRTMSLPSSGGLTIGQILKLVEPFDLGQYDSRSFERYHALIEAFHLAYADRGAYMGDKLFVDAPWQGLLDDEYVKRRRRLISFDEAGPERSPGDPWSFQPGNPYRVSPLGDSGTRERRATDLQSDRGQTTHFTVADSDGNMVSWTSTIEQFFGTKMMVPGYGFMLNNELTDFDATPGGPNEVQPNKRPLSSTSPTIVFRDGDPYMTVGSPGGKTIITTVAQVLLNVVEYGMSLQSAIAAPRLYADVDPAVYWEEGVPDGVRKKLRARGHALNDDPTQLGNVQAIRVLDSGKYRGAADGRRNGAVYDGSE
ncbi:gamma-glutamyltransferase [Haladaptatus sp. CMAA 1911]|uniref:gamma-glutamyltransferase n=1 Tax=unclassified Haladaptatus TaxID=2622732 RepID=UPI0037544F4F